MTSTLRMGAEGGGGGGLRQKWDVIGRSDWGIRKCSGHPIFIFFIYRKLDLGHDQTSC